MLTSGWKSIARPFFERTRSRYDADWVYNQKGKLYPEYLQDGSDNNLIRLHPSVLSSVFMKYSS